MVLQGGLGSHRGWERVRELGSSRPSLVSQEASPAQVPLLGPPETCPPCPAASVPSGSPAAGRGPLGTQSPGPAKAVMIVRLWSCSHRELSDPFPSPDPSRPGWDVSNVGLWERRGVRAPDLIHENVEDTGGDRQWEGGQEECKKPGRCVHGRVEALGAEVGVQVRELLLRGRGEEVQHHKDSTGHSHPYPQVPSTQKCWALALQLRGSLP